MLFCVVVVVVFVLIAIKLKFKSISLDFVSSPKSIDIFVYLFQSQHFNCTLAIYGVCSFIFSFFTFKRMSFASCHPHKHEYTPIVDRYWFELGTITCQSKMLNGENKYTISSHLSLFCSFSFRSFVSSFNYCYRFICLSVLSFAFILYQRCSSFVLFSVAHFSYFVAFYFFFVQEIAFRFLLSLN